MRDLEKRLGKRWLTHESDDGRWESMNRYDVNMYVRIGKRNVIIQKCLKNEYSIVQSNPADGSIPAVT